MVVGLPGARYQIRCLLDRHYHNEWFHMNLAPSKMLWKKGFEFFWWYLVSFATLLHIKIWGSSSNYGSWLIAMWLAMTQGRLSLPWHKKCIAMNHFSWTKHPLKCSDKKDLMYFGSIWLVLRPRAIQKNGVLAGFTAQG